MTFATGHGARMQDELKLCLVQMTSAATHGPNSETMRSAAAEAQAAGCHLLALPEVAGLMNRRATPAQIVPAQVDPYIATCREVARETGLWINTGSTPVMGPDGRNLNHCDLIGPQGDIRASYDKIHLFDVALEGKAPIGESKRFSPGTEAVLADTPWGLWGLTICYDLRFPALYRAVAQAGARLIFVPSAFTVPTGNAHWHTLLRARAIENLCWIVAAAQTGRHEDGRETFGHALVVNPWGEVVLDMGTGLGTAVVTVDLSEADRARAQIPSLDHDRPFALRRS